MAYLGLALLALGLAVLWLAGRTRRAADLPAGRLLAQDTLGARRSGEPLYDPVLDLSGRPDYLVDQGGRLIPVEIKSGHSHAGPRSSHRLQLAAYCRLVEAVYARRPPYGVLRYADRAFRIPFDRRLEQELRHTLASLREEEGRPQPRSHEAAERCRACGFRDGCDQALA